MNKTSTTAIATALAILLTTGCASQTQSEREFGNAVRSVTTGQTYDIGAALYPSDDVITGGDAERLENVAKSHSADVGSADRVQRPIELGAGSGNRQ